MKKTITANIGGFVFNIDEDAYEMLHKYIQSIRSHFKNQEGREEIIEDIEGRIAELFNENINDSKQVINNADVEKVIDVMGRPEQYETDEAEDSGSSKSSGRAFRSSRRIYRDGEEKMLGGVCSGISHYLDWDPIILRILLVILVLTFGSGILIYLLLWILLPEATTTAEKLQMKGEKINVDNISKKVKEGFENVGEAFRGKGGSGNFKSGVENSARRTRPFIKTIGRILGAFIGAILLLIAFGMIITLVLGTFATNTMFPDIHPLDYDFLRDYIFFDENWLKFGILAAFLIVLSPIIDLLYRGIKLLLNIKTSIKGFGWMTFSLFFIGIVIGGIVAVKQCSHYTQGERIDDKFTLNRDSTNFITVDINHDSYFDNDIDIRDSTPFELLDKDNNEIICGYPNLNIYHSDHDEAYVRIRKRSNGRNSRDAINNAKEIEYNFDITDSSLSLDPYFKTSLDKKLKFQRVDIDIHIPKGTTVQFGEKMERIANYPYRWADYYRRDLSGHTFEITSKGPKCLDCK